MRRAAASDPAAKKGKGAAPTDMIKVTKCRVIIVQAVLGVVEGFKARLSRSTLLVRPSLPSRTLKSVA